MDDHAGEQFGDYRLTQILGKGNFGDVYLAEHMACRCFSEEKIRRTITSKTAQEFAE